VSHRNELGGKQHTRQSTGQPAQPWLASWAETPPTTPPSQCAQPGADQPRRSRLHQHDTKLPGRSLWGLYCYWRVLYGGSAGLHAL